MKLFGAVLFICCIFPTGHLLAQSQLHVETGAVWQQRNDVQVPGTKGSRFALDEIAGSGPTEFVRVVFSTVWHDRHSLRLVYAPLRIKEAGTSLQALDFSGTAFDDGKLVATYQFDAHRASYRYRVLQTDRSALHVGATLLVRDAEIRLDQNGEVGRDTNVGVVPLLHLAGHYKVTPRWQFRFDLDGLAAPQGRAFDIGLQSGFAISDQWAWFIGYRLLDGGVDNDEVYNFARFHYATTGLRVQF